ncbi:MAG TPA: ABC transporter permease [Acidimicrobiales bacterium]|nr:ABC transporter permease [Acidimicrobiales bacterium]
MSALGAGASAGSRRLVDVIFRVREVGILAGLALLVVITTAIRARFLNEQNIDFILSDTNIFALLGVGEAMVVISRNVDLSVGSVVGLSAYLSGHLFSQVQGIPVPVVFLAGLAIGLACGAFNGAVVALARVPSLVVTLATLYIIRGLDVVIVGGNQVVASTLPNSFHDISTTSFFGVPVLSVVVAAGVAVAAYYMRCYRSGRELYAIGSNPEAARLAGIPIGKRVFGAFVASGAIAGLAGVLWASTYQTVDSTAGTSYELQVVAGVVVGGVAIFGGSGTVAGAALGALLLQSILTALNVLSISSYWDPAIYGLLLLVAIAVDRGIAVQLTSALRKRNLRYGA